MTETYLLRAMLEFAFDSEQEYLAGPKNLPARFGPFLVDYSPNSEFYLMDLGLLEPDSIAGSPNWEYPVSLLYVETEIEVPGAIKASFPEDQHPQDAADDILEQLEAMFRLFQKGHVYLGRHKVWHLRDEVPKQVIFLPHRPAKAEPATLYHRGQYRLDDETLVKFIEFFSSYWDIVHRKPEPLCNALYRFSSSYERRTLVDRLTELVVALEALFGDSGSGGDSLAYKIALRCSCLLYPPSEARSRAFKAIICNAISSCAYLAVEIYWKQPGVGGAPSEKDYDSGCRDIHCSHSG